MISEVYCRDCLDAMKEYPDKYFDLCIADPPYGIGIQTMNFTTSGAKRPSRKSAAKRRDYTLTGDWDKKPGKETFDEMRRVSRRQIIWGGNYFTDYLPPSKSFVVWDKRCDDALTNDFADCEYAWLSNGMGVARVYRFLWSGMLQGDMKNKQERIHATEKPIALYRWLLQHYAKEGDKILDPFLGSGSSRIAAYELGFDFVGFEINKDFVNKQEERFQKFTSQLSLFY